ncbi:carbon-nitrogen hydrolase [Penicillium canescens]|nr:carbon-nitrogen hydrolase [Penicillium canescens]
MTGRPAALRGQQAIPCQQSVCKIPIKRGVCHCRIDSIEWPQYKIKKLAALDILVISFSDIVVAIQLTVQGLAGTCMATALPRNYTTPDFNNLTVALVQAQPANWPLPLMNKNWTGVEFDPNRTVAKGADLITGTEWGKPGGVSV